MDIKKKIIKKFKLAYGRALDKHERGIISSVLTSKDFGQVIVNSKVENINRIGIILLSIEKFEGGETSVLRLGTGLANLGYDVSYVIYGKQSIAELEENAKHNLSTYKGKIIKAKEVSYNSFDVVVATSWVSVYKATGFNAYKMYFVQDYEPYFFKLNERYLLAKLTYEIGLHIVSLGKWNLKQIKRECQTTSELDYIDFPYEKSEYSRIERNYKDYSRKKSFRLAVYIKEDGKRIPNIVQYILKNASDELKSKGFDLDICFFGLNKRYRTIVGKNLGKLNKEELAELYKKSDFGMVASMSNISLVPYEMLSTGLPIFEFRDGSFLDFFNEKCAILLDYNSKTFVNRFLEVVSNPEKISFMINESSQIMNNLSWENSCRQFANIMEEKCKYAG